MLGVPTFAITSHWYMDPTLAFYLLLDVFMVLVLVAIVVAIIYRYVVRPPRLEASLEAAVILALIFGLVAAALIFSGLAYSRGEMIGFTLLIDAVPPWLKRPLKLVTRLAIIALLLVVAWYGVEFAWRTRHDISTGLQVSMFWIHLSIPVGSIIAALHVLSSHFTDRDGEEKEALAESRS